MIIELGLDGSLAIRFKEHYLNYRELPAGDGLGGSAPKPPKFSAATADARVGEEEQDQGPVDGPQSPGVQPTDGRSGRTSAEPYPPDGKAEDTRKGRTGPAKEHPWRKPFKPQK